MEERYLKKTRMLDYDAERIVTLVKEHGWNALSLEWQGTDIFVQNGSVVEGLT